MRRLKIGIKPQLIILVCFSSLLSLLILAIVTGVYFSHLLLNLRADRLEVISQLKTSQVKQLFEFVFYQAYFLSTKDTVYSPLVLYRAGNNSAGVFNLAQELLDQFLQLLETFAAARLYNLNLDIMANSYSNFSNILTPVMDLLYPLLQNASVPQALLELEGQVLDMGMALYFTGPAANTLDPDSAYFMGLTIPVYANTSIIFNTPQIAGYLLVIALALLIQQLISDTFNSSDNRSRSAQALSAGKSLPVDYLVLVVKPYYLPGANELVILGFETVFPIADHELIPGVVYLLELLPMVATALLHSFGYRTDVRSFSDLYAIGYTQVQLTSTTYWTVIIQQLRGVFTAPVNKLRNIIIGVVIGIGVFMCLVTFPLAVWFVRPVTRLKEATEAITKSKKRGLAAAAAAQAAAHSHPPAAHATGAYEADAEGLLKRNLVTSGSSLGALSLSYGIFLPDKIPQSKHLFKDEFTELSEAFNIMTEELDRQYTHLEDRVKVRTKELELSKIEAELANEAKTVFIANILHELRTPLNGILGMTSIAMDEKDTTRIKDSLKLIHRSGELLLHILTELLTYSKNTLNRSKLEKLNFQVLEIMYQVQSIFGKLAMDQRVNLRLYLKPQLLRRLVLYGDLNRIFQIVMNLVSNSLKFTPVDGQVGVSFKLLGEYDHVRLKQELYKEVYVVHDGENEKQSIHTVSSDEYNEILSEMLVDSKKPLPQLPEADADDQQAEPNGDAAVSEKLAGSAQNTPSADAFNGSAAVSYPFHRNGSYSSRNVDIEINKNNKLYGIKRLPKTKSWVLQIQVTDTGPGIEPALQEKVFEPFIQGDQTLSRSYGGTGLGLSICRQLATMMKGTLKLDSEIGVGSTFTFTVPLPQTHEIVVPPEDMKEFCEDAFNPDSKVNRKVAFDENVVINNGEESNAGAAFTAETSEAAADPPNGQQEPLKPPATTSLAEKPSFSSSSSSSNGHGEKLDVSEFEKPYLITRGSTGTANSAKYSDTSSHEILDKVGELNVLVAEDNMVNQEVIKRMLRLEGIDRISMACNGAEAIEQLERSILANEPFDMVFMDIQMPKVDGLLATRRIRQNLDYTNPIIALTAFADESNVKECLNSGMSGFLSKPIKRANLRKVIYEFSVDLDLEARAKERTDGVLSPTTLTH
jgi:osomolarity two-component system sensor histidine kinase SLN1